MWCLGAKRAAGSDDGRAMVVKAARIAQPESVVDRGSSPVEPEIDDPLRLAGELLIRNRPPAHQRLDIGPGRAQRRQPMAAFQPKRSPDRASE